jgi:signal transduction histidine kinase
MKQVFINLLTNAAEAMPEGGTITIAADSSQNIHNKKIVRIVIIDTGCGIFKGDKQRAFDPFYTTKKKSGGSGLGLSVVKGIIEKHKGDIRIESEPGKGTSVIIELQCDGKK